MSVSLFLNMACMHSANQIFSTSLSLVVCGRKRYAMPFGSLMCFRQTGIWTSTRFEIWNRCSYRKLVPLALFHEERHKGFAITWGYSNHTAVIRLGKCGIWRFSHGFVGSLDGRPVSSCLQSSSDRHALFTFCYDLLLFPAELMVLVQLINILVIDRYSLDIRR